MDLMKLSEEKRKFDGHSHGHSPGIGDSQPVDRRRRDMIDENIRRVYEDLLEDEVPDRFKKLLDQLREQDAQKDGGK